MFSFNSNLLTIFLLAFCMGVIFKRLFPPQKTVLSSDSWDCKSVGFRYILSLKNGVEITQALMEFVEKAGIKAGTVSGIGAINALTLRFFNPETKKYVDKTFNQQMEITNLIGNISFLDGKPYLHLHVTASDETYQAVGGHLLSATLCGAGEIIIEAFPDAEIKRTFSEEIGLNVFDLKK